MAELAPKERLQPALLERLTDHEPDKTVESREQRVMSLEKLRKSVIRDLEWLFNAINLASTIDLDAFPRVAESVLNYGLPGFGGRAASSFDAATLERHIRQAIWCFEPRILRNTLQVRAILDEKQMNRNTIAFEISGDLWAQPTPVRLFLKTEVDLEDKRARVVETGW
jgi:type VI secretion system protein ImpF